MSIKKFNQILSKFIVRSLHIYSIYIQQVPSIVNPLLPYQLALIEFHLDHNNDLKLQLCHVKMIHDNNNIL